MRALYRSALGTALAGAITVAPAASIAAPDPAPDSSVRAASGVERSEDLAGNALLIAGVAVVALVLFVLILDDDDEDLPTSP